MVIVSREPDGRWYVTFTIDTDAPVPLPGTGRVIGVDLGVKDFAVTSDGERMPSPRHLERKARSLAAGQAVTACGAGVRHTGTSRVRPAVKQEPRPVTAGIPVLQGGE
jgi:hypothetical protein